MINRKRIKRRTHMRYCREKEERSLAPWLRWVTKQCISGKSETPQPHTPTNGDYNATEGMKLLRRIVTQRNNSQQREGSTQSQLPMLLKRQKPPLGTRNHRFDNKENCRTTNITPIPQIVGSKQNTPHDNNRSQNQLSATQSSLQFKRMQLAVPINEPTEARRMMQGKPPIGGSSGNHKPTAGLNLSGSCKTRREPLKLNLLAQQLYQGRQTPTNFPSAPGGAKGRNNLRLGCLRTGTQSLFNSFKGAHNPHSLYERYLEAEPLAPWQTDDTQLVPDISDVAKDLRNRA